MQILLFFSKGHFQKGHEMIKNVQITGKYATVWHDREGECATAIAHFPKILYKFECKTADFRKVCNGVLHTHIPVYTVYGIFRNI